MASLTIFSPAPRKMSCSIHADADRQQDIRIALLVCRLDRQDVVFGANSLVKIPFFDRLQLDPQFPPTGSSCDSRPRPADHPRVRRGLPVSVFMV